MSQNNLLYQTLRIRRIEEAIADDYKNLNMRCPTHLSIGQEAVAVGVCANLRKTDKVFSGHRAHAHYLAKGGSLKALIGELYGKATGCCKGRGGSMHLQDLDVGFVASTAIVGGTVPLAVGSAWASKLKGTDEVTVIFFGDGCFEEGVVHESMNFAVLHGLPIVFVCENNALAVTTPFLDRQNKLISAVAEANGLETNFSMWDNIEYISELAQQAISQARKGIPQFIEFLCERERVHCGIEFEHQLTDDCLVGYNVDETEIHREISEAFEFARKSPVPTNPHLGVFA